MPLVIWYPAQVGPKDRRATIPRQPRFRTAQGTCPLHRPGACRQRCEAERARGYPIVLLSHGYNNDPVMLSWLGENLATKGYASSSRSATAIRRSPIPRRRPQRLIRRPLDITYVLRRIRDGLLGPLGDPARIALAGYSFGG